MFQSKKMIKSNFFKQKLTIMGIPTFFRSIIQNNKAVIQGAVPDGVVDYLFIDFNSLVYNTWYRIHKSISTQDTDTIHNQLISSTISTTCHMVNDIVQPKKYVYISMDGVAPRAKMVQQRSRRYKSVQLKEIIKAKMGELGMEKPVEWDPSPNICPGTIFMEKLGQAFRLAMKQKKFNCQVILSDTSCPGEGEHKFLKRIRLIHKSLETQNDSVVVYSPDGDMISLSLLTHKNNIRIMRIPDSKSPQESKFCKDFEFIYCDLNILRQDFFKQLTETYQDQEINELRILNDYNFLLFMVGNDFVPSLPFLKIRSGGLDLLIKIYNQLRPKIKDYFVNYDPITQKTPKINNEFFKELVLSLAKMENTEMIHEYNQILKEQEGAPNGRRSRMESEMTPLEIYQSRFEHLCFFNPLHPDNEKYRHLPGIIDYHKPKHDWKSQYYKHFFGFDTSNISEYNTGRTKVVTNYFESLMFTLQYYLKGCPCFDWSYEYRVSPIPSDMYTVLSKHNFDINSISFHNKPPYSPYEQLLLILPPQMSFLLPKPLREIMTEKEYPKAFTIDALAGSKYIYSEAILPEIDSEKIKTLVSTKLDKLSEAEINRNTNTNKLMATPSKLV
jgi:5'-3' exonuclease